MARRTHRTEKLVSQTVAGYEQRIRDLLLVCEREQRSRLLLQKENHILQIELTLQQQVAANWRACNAAADLMIDTLRNRLASATAQLEAARR
jgi:hypothetical protein